MSWGAIGSDSVQKSGSNVFRFIAMNFVPAEKEALICRDGKWSCDNLTVNWHVEYCNDF